MNEEIGAAAGQVWEALNAGGELTLAQLKKTSGVDEPLLGMALGWLAREDKLAFSKDKRGMRVSLK